MKPTFILLTMVVAIAVLTCTVGPDHNEKISKPAKPVGDETSLINVNKTYTVGRVSSNLDHPLSYRFDFDAKGSHDYTNWSLLDTAVVSWPEPDLYEVTVQARCAIHLRIESSWSEGTEVAVGNGSNPPRVNLATFIRGVRKPYDPAAAADTVGMFKPFQISYHGSRFGMPIEAYKFFPLTPGIDLPGANKWTADLSDTVRTFPNTGGDALPSGIFRLAVRCRDVVGAESPVDKQTFQEGVAQVVVNFDPDTEITGARSAYSLNDVTYYDYPDIKDGIPDTVPLYSWLRIDYSGTDDPRDGTSCSPPDPNLCVGFHVAYHLSSVHESGIDDFSLWQPRDGVHDTDPSSARDYNTFSIGPFEYELSVRAVDENTRPDATPPHLDIVGNHDPTLDRVVVEDHLGNEIFLSIVDTVTWNFWKGEGWPYECECDTVDKPEAFCFNQQDPFDCQFKSFPDNGESYDYYKSFSVRIKAWGHDHPMDPTGSGVKAWRYLVKYRSGATINLGKSQVGWFESGQLDVLDDVIRWKVFYPGPDSPLHDPNGDTVFARLPGWLNRDLIFVLTGKDMGTNPPPYQQFVFINGERERMNEFTAYLGSLGRRTQERVFAFQIRLVR